MTLNEARSRTGMSSVVAWFLFLILLAAGTYSRAEATTTKAPPQQPLPFSHKQHVSVGLKCSDCHQSPDPGEKMTFPATSKCMACHVAIAKDKPAIKKLASYAKSGQAVPWISVYSIPDWVWFSHQIHVDAGARCDECHGPVAQREILSKEVDLSMNTCMNCHRKNNATVDCNACHQAH
jgi:hypothetical protein